MFILHQSVRDSLAQVVESWLFAEFNPKERFFLSRQAGRVYYMLECADVYGTRTSSYENGVLTIAHKCT